MGSLVNVASPFTMPKTISIVLVTGLFGLLIRILMIGRRPKNYPPGPPTIPVLGNLHLFPKEKMHLQLQKWSKEYGPIFSLMVGTQTWVVLSSDRVIKDLLDKRSNKYSSRPDMYIARELASGNSRYLMMGYDARWRSYRKLAHTFLNVQVSKKYIVYQDMETKQVLNDLIDTPESWKEHFRRYTTSLSAIMVFGYRFPVYTKGEVEMVFAIMDKFSILTRSLMASLLDFYPVLRNIPEWMNPIAGYARTMYAEAIEQYRFYWLKVKENEERGIGIPSFSQDLARAQEKEGLSDDNAAFLCGMLMEAGGDTTATTLQGFLQAMAIYPECFVKLKEEVDRVVGDERMPNLEDWDEMPYLRATMKELLRWLPAAVLGMPHATSEDDEYMGYHIPKGAWVFGNIWGINSDENRHPEPRRFNPDRYLGDDSTAIDSAALADPTKRDHFSFGFGRRICQGIHLAERSLFISLSRLAWGFEIKKARDASGKEIGIEQDNFSDGTVFQLAPFQVDVTPRSQIRVDRIRKDWAEAKRGFEEMNLPV